MFVQKAVHLNTDFIISTRKHWKQRMFFLCPTKCHYFQKLHCVEYIIICSTGSRWENQTCKLIAPKMPAFQKQSTKLKREPRQKNDVFLTFGSSDLPMVITVVYGKFSVSFPPHQDICTSTSSACYSTCKLNSKLLESLKLYFLCILIYTSYGT